MNFGLSQHTIELINGVFTTYLSIDKVIIYGSRAMGTNKEGSNIDLIIKSNHYYRSLNTEGIGNISFHR